MQLFYHIRKLSTLQKRTLAQMMASQRTCEMFTKTLEKSWIQVLKSLLLNGMTFKLEKKKKKIINMDKNTQEVKPVVAEKSEEVKVEPTQPAST